MVYVLEMGYYSPVGVVGVYPSPAAAKKAAELWHSDCGFGGKLVGRWMRTVTPNGGLWTRGSSTSRYYQIHEIEMGRFIRRWTQNPGRASDE